LPAEGADNEAVMQAWLRAQLSFRTNGNRRGAEDAEERRRICSKGIV
jgi:hypothetical protein